MPELRQSAILYVCFALFFTACTRVGNEGSSLEIVAPDETFAFDEVRPTVSDPSRIREASWSVFGADGSTPDEVSCSGRNEKEARCHFQEEGERHLALQARLVNGASLQLRKTIRVRSASERVGQPGPVIAARILEDGIPAACYRTADSVCTGEPKALDHSIPLRSPRAIVLDLTSSQSPDRSEPVEFEIQLPAFSDQFERLPGGILDLGARVLHRTPSPGPGSFTVKVRATGQTTRVSSVLRVTFEVSCPEELPYELNLASPAPAGWIESVDGKNLVLAHPSRLLRTQPLDTVVRVDVNGDGIADMPWSDLPGPFRFYSAYFGNRQISVQFMQKTCRFMRSIVVPSFVPKPIVPADPSLFGREFVKANLRANSTTLEPESGFYRRSTDVELFLASKDGGKFANRLSCSQLDQSGGVQIDLFAKNAFPEEELPGSNLPYQIDREHSLALRTQVLSRSLVPRLTYPTSQLPPPVTVPSGQLEFLQYFTDQEVDHETRMRFRGTGCPMSNLKIKFLSASPGNCTVCTRQTSVDYVAEVSADFSCRGLPELKAGSRTALDVNDGRFLCRSVAFRHVVQQCDTYDACACNPCSSPSCAGYDPCACNPCGDPACSLYETCSSCGRNCPLPTYTPAPAPTYTWTPAPAPQPQPEPQPQPQPQPEPAPAPEPPPRL